MKLILASGSPYRKQQLQSLGYSFSVVPANIDESRLDGESTRQLALRLARSKAETVGSQIPDAAIIGSDQVGICDLEILRKPGTHERALAQLFRLSGKVVTFETALVVKSPRTSVLADSIATTIQFRKFSLSEAETYVELDRPFDCAGAFKSEARGSLLFDWVRSNDPSALVGLPLIKTAEFLRKLGINPLSPTESNSQ